MAASAEQKLLMDVVVDLIGQMQRAVKASLPGNTVLHAEFRVGEPEATTPLEAVALGRALLPAALEYRALLLGRGIDGARLSRFRKALEDLERLSPVEPEPAPEPAEAKATRKPPVRNRRKSA